MARAICLTIDRVLPNGILRLYMYMMSMVCVIRMVFCAYGTEQLGSVGSQPCCEFHSLASIVLWQGENLRFLELNIRDARVIRV